MNGTLEALGFGLGTTELVIILLILIFIFGASRIPDLAKSLGSGVRGFRDSLKGEDEPKQLESDAASHSTTETSNQTTEASSESRS